MVILVNLSPSALKVEFQDGNKTHFKQLPTNTFVAMKGLNESSQISNRDFLALHKDVTIYNYDLSTYYNRGAGLPTTAAFPFMFVDNNQKPGDAVTFTNTNTVSGLTNGYATLKTMM